MVAADSGTPPDPLAEAILTYRKVWAEAPLEAWSERASERLTALARAVPTAQAPARARTAAEWVTRGTALFDANRNVESEAAFVAALASPGLDAELECRARFNRAQSVWKQRQRQRAAPLFDEAEPACARAGNRDLHAKSLYQAGRCYASIADRDKAAARYARIEAEHADHSYADDARLRTAELATDAGDDALATKLLSEVPDALPAGRSSQRGALAPGVHRLARGTLRRGARPGSTRTCAPFPTRRSGTPRGARSTGRGASSRSNPSPSWPAPRTSARSASIRSRSMRCCRSPACARARRRRWLRWSASSAATSITR